MTGTTTTDLIFRQQIKDDIELIQDKVPWDSNIKKDEYAFNYWVLSKIYNLDEEVAENYITEYNDKGIDCFVHYEEDKELYIIQNKYYSEGTKLSSQDVSDLLTRPLACLNEGNYKSKELQEIYNKAKKDSEYKIFLHFFVTHDNKKDDVARIVRDHKDKVGSIAEVFYLSDIKDKYYGKSYEESVSLNFELSLKVRGSALRILPDEYGLKNMSKAFYVMAKVQEIHQLWKNAKEGDYPLFEENIREYLGGTSGINKSIMDTLEKPEERHKFFYYNNGITIICSDADAKARYVTLTNPQVVNGCQTVSSIAEVFEKKNYNKNEFEDVYVMAKILVIEEDAKDNDFYRDIVKYTNSQNSINEKVFGAAHKMFHAIKRETKKRGILLCVKQSDKNTIKGEYKSNKSKGELLLLANKTLKGFYEFNSIPDAQIDIESLIQIIGAFTKDAYFAYTKKALLLKPSNKEYYQDFSLRINETFTAKQMVNLIILYKRADRDKRESGVERTPIPYYLLNFLGFYLSQNDIKRETFLEKVTADQLEIVYEQFRNLSKKYYEKYLAEYGFDYTQMVKKEVDNDIMREVLKVHFDILKEYLPDEYKKFKKVISDFKI